MLVLVMFASEIGGLVLFSLCSLVPSAGDLVPSTLYACWPRPDYYKQSVACRLLQRLPRHPLHAVRPLPLPVRQLTPR